MTNDEAWNEWFNAEHYRTAEMGTGWFAACLYKDKRIAELEERLIDVRDYVNNSALIPPELRREIEVLINVILSEGDADE